MTSSGDHIDPTEVSERAAALRHRIEVASPLRDIRVVAVTKGFGVEAPRAALAAGFTMLGENYGQELLRKNELLTPEERSRVEWHFLGRLQRNKVRSLAPIVSVWQSVDRTELIDEIARRAPSARIMVQLNLSDEPQKGGASFEECDALVDHARTRGLDVIGLMGVGRAGEAEATGEAFARLVATAEALSLAERSIGMSDDLELAIAAGSTMVRVGTGLFGQRAPKSGI